MTTLPYEARLIRAQLEIGITPGTLAICRVQHDIGCPMLTKRKDRECKCTPHISIETNLATFHVTLDGRAVLAGTN